MTLKSYEKTGIPPSHGLGGRNYNGIDLIKFLCSFLVFCIHVPYFQDEATHLQEFTNFLLRHTVARLAVPFYFVCSGYFLFRKMPLHDLDVGGIKNYCYKILRLFATWSILLFTGGTYHLWYLRATVVAVVFISLLLYRRISLRSLFLLTLALYGFGLLGDAYSFLAEPLIAHRLFGLPFRIYGIFYVSTRNGLFMGTIFVLMGAAFAHSKISLSPGKSLLGLILSVFLLVVEEFFLRYRDVPPGNLFIFLLPAVYFLFSFGIQWKLPDSPIYPRLRAAGLWLYFIHVFVSHIFTISADKLEELLGLQIAPYRFLLTLTSTVILSFGLEALSRRERFKWLNWLI